MRLFLISFLFVFLFSTHAVSGQEPVVTATEQVFSFDPYPDGPARISNELLQRIAQGNGRLRSYTRFRVKADVVAQLEEPANGQMMASLRMANVRYSGDVMYRDFSLEKILLPNRMDLNLQVLDAAGKVITEILLEDASVPANGGPVLKLELPQDVQHQAASLKPFPLRLFYSAEAFGRFEGWFDALEEYYAAGALLERAAGMIQGLDVARVESLMQQEFDLCEAERLYNQVKYASFHHWIDLHRSDPRHIMSLLQDLEFRIVVLRNDFNEAVADIDSLFYHEGMLAALEERTDDARSLLASALTYNPFHIPSHLAIANIDLQNGDKEHALQRMGQVISKMYPPQKEHKLAREITAEILEDFFSEARELTWANRYLDALAMLEPVEGFCQQVEGFMPCPSELQHRMTAAHVGMYRSFLTVSARARKNNNLAFAETYIASALEYQQANSGFLPHASEAMEQMQMVLARYVENGVMNMELMDYGKAAGQFTLALSLYEKYPQLVCPPGLENLLAEATRLGKKYPQEPFIEQPLEILPGRRPSKGSGQGSGESL